MSLAIARRYARAVFELGRDSGTLDKIVAELGRFASAYESSAELREIDRLPNLGDKERRGILEELGKKLGASDIAVRTVAMLADRQRLELLPDMAWLLAEMHDQHAGVVRVSVKSAKPLASDYLARLTQKIESATGKKAIVESAVDPALIAGVVATVGDKVIDGSVRGRLDRLAASLRQS
jgi:F-type H+-transporting ATPase subunit delta